jgi:hypothetical protein
MQLYFRFSIPKIPPFLLLQLHLMMANNFLPKHVAISH